MRVTVAKLVVSVLAMMAAAPLQAETLADAMVAAYKNSKLLEQNQALLRVQDENVAQAVATLRPVVRFVTESRYAHSEVPVVLPANALLGTPAQYLGRTDTETLDTTMQLVAQMTLLDFGRNRTSLEIAKETVLATREALRAAEQRVLLEAVNAYVSVRLQQEILALRQNNVRVIGQELQAARDRFDVGEVTRTDVAIAEASLAAAQSGLASAQGDLTVARERYKAVTGAYPGDLAALPALPEMAKTVESAREIALVTHPLINQKKREVTVADLSVTAARANMRPSLTGTAALSTQAEGDPDRVESASVGLSLSQTIYAGGALSSGYRQAVARRDAARADLAQTAITLGEDVGVAWSQVQVAQASISAGDQQIEAARTAFDGVREEATLGARTTLDVLDAEQNLLDARATRATAAAKRYVGVYNLLATMGLMTVDHLKLGVPSYDPAVYYEAVRRAPVTSPQGKALDRLLGKVGGAD